MNATTYLLVILTALFFSFTASAQKIESSKSKSWPSAKSDVASAELDLEEIDLESEIEATPINEDEIEELEDLSSIKNELQEVDDLLAEDSEDLALDNEEYEVVETKFVNGQPVTTTKRLNPNQTNIEVTNNKQNIKTRTTVKTTSKLPKKSKTKKKTTTTTTSTVFRANQPRLQVTPVTTPVIATPVVTDSTIINESSETQLLEAKPKKKIIRRVLRKKGKKPVKKAARSNRARKRITTVRTQMPIIKKKSKRNFHIMPVLGTSYSQMQGTYLTNVYHNTLESDFGFSGGVLAEYTETDWMFGFEIGAIYNKITTVGDNVIAANLPVTLDFMQNEYIMIPASLKFYPVKTERFGVFAKAGIAGGVLLNSEFSERRNGSLNVNSGNSTGLFKDGEFQWHVGLGAKFNINKNFGFGVEGTFFKSFSDITEASTNVFGGEARIVGSNIFGGVFFNL